VQISAQAYQALRDALPAIMWHKRAFESFLRDALRSHPELLAGLDFNGATKRETADALISRLATNESTYRSPRSKRGSSSSLTTPEPFVIDTWRCTAQTILANAAERSKSC
jgi:ribosomal protein L16 Arg81 hydroxylase